MVCQRFEVLYDGGEMEFVACTGEPPQPHSFEAVMGLQMCKAHLNLFALVTRFLERRCSIERTRMIAGVLVDVARDYALWSVRAALGLKEAQAAVVGARRIAQHVARENAARRFEELTCWTNVYVAVFVEPKVAP